MNIQILALYSGLGIAYFFISEQFGIERKKKGYDMRTLNWHFFLSLFAFWVILIFFRYFDLNSLVSDTVGTVLFYYAMETLVIMYEKKREEE